MSSPCFGPRPSIPVDLIKRSDISSRSAPEHKPNVSSVLRTPMQYSQGLSYFSSNALEIKVKRLHLVCQTQAAAIIEAFLALAFSLDLNDQVLLVTQNPKLTILVHVIA